MSPGQDSMFRRVHVPLIVVYLLMGVIGLLAVGILTYAVSDHAANAATEASEKRIRDAQANAQIAAAAGCDRNQIQRAYILLRSREVKSPTADVAEGYFSIVDCKETYVERVNIDPSRPVYLSIPLQECFLKLVADQGFGLHAENVTTDPKKLHEDYNCT